MEKFTRFFVCLFVVYTVVDAKLKYSCTRKDHIYIESLPPTFDINKNWSKVRAREARVLRV